jgi:ribosomal protein S18 acetylase RimI-like enzyme
MLLDAHGALHDVYVLEHARRAHVGERLVREVCARLDAKGAPRVLLSTMVSNVGAQHVFERCGFRKTMIEMTRERGAGKDAAT